MSNSKDTLTIVREHGEQMYKLGLSFGRKDVRDEIFDMLVIGNHLGAAQAVLDMDKGDSDE